MKEILNLPLIILKLQDYMPKQPAQKQQDLPSRSKSITRSQKLPEPVAPPKTKASKAAAPKNKAAAEAIETSPVRDSRSKKNAPLKKKTALSKSVDQRNQSSETNEYKSESESDQEVAYKTGDVIAFVDKDDAEQGKMTISIGKVIRDVIADSTELGVHHFVALKSTDKCPTEFTQAEEEGELTINVYQIISIAEQSSKKGSSTKMSFSKATIMKVKQLLENAFDGIREKVNSEIDNKVDSSEQSESEESEEEVKAASKKTAPKTQPIVRAKRTTANTQANPLTKPQLSTNIRSASVNAAKKIKEVAEDEEGEEGSMDEAEDDEKPKKVLIGKKRAAPFNGAASQIVSRQVKKLADGTEEQIVKVVAKPKKPAKKPVVFKAGKWNPDTELLTKNHEIEHFGTSESPIYTCCLRCNNRNVIRAIENDNIRLFRTLVYDQQNIPSLTDAWSAESPHLNPMSLILEKKNKDMLEVIFKIPQRNAADLARRNQVLSEFYVSDRIKVKPYLLNRVETGNVSYKAYGTAVRRVEQTRGNRQGNQAFYFEQMQSGVPTLDLSQAALKSLTVDILKNYQLLTGDTQDFVYQLQSLARAGNREFLIWLMEPLIKQENYGFNELHLDVLKLDKLTKKYHTASITKKANSAGQITPLHLACINPNKEVITTLLEQNNDINVMDQQNYKPIHYAAACSEVGPLSVLLEKGANLFDFTNQKETALHIASMNGNAAIIKAILENNITLYKFRDRKNKTAMTYACELGEIEPIKAFLDHSGGKVKVNTGQGIARMTPLMYAASQGRYELAEFLLERKARVLSKDKFKRTALIMAVRNGHTRLASLLLQNGSEWNHCDSSFNTPLHYAAGSGFIECVDLLIRHGADVNAQNSWKVSPITIAMLNNHLGTVKRLLQEPTVDVNGKDDKGRTLLMMNMIDLSEQSCVNFAKYLLDKGADPNIADVDGNTPLHRLAAYKVQHQEEKFKRIETEERKSLLSMIDLLISRGGQLNILNADKKNPFSIALDTDNIDVLHKFAESVKISEDPQLLHKFKSKVFDDRYKSILLGLLNKEAHLESLVMNIQDKKGFSPFLAYVEQYIDGLKAFTFSAKIREAIQWNAWKHQQRYNNYVITNEEVFSPKFQHDRDYISARSRDVQNIPEDKIQELIRQYIKQLITLPFINFIRTLIAKGADPHAKVDKIEFYRELDEHKRTLALVGEAREGIMAGQQGPNEEMQIDTNQRRVPVDVKTRQEVLAEQRVEKKDGKKLTKEERANKRVSKVLKDFYAKKGHQAVFKRENGKLVEIEFDKEYGMQNAIHFVMRHCSKTFFDFLVDELKTPVDEVDYQGRNPFMLSAISDPTKPNVTESLQRLLNMKVRFDIVDSRGRTPFLIYYENRNMSLANKLLDQGANILQIDNQGLFALKYALIRRENAEISRLVVRGADINQIDNKGRNLLHHAVNMSSATADATFETEQLLIDLGININLRDNQQRVPLHYAFVKIKDWTSSQQIDPIETVSSLCGQRTLEINVPDKWLKTPLHYAAQRGASICTLYILNRGSDIEAPDIYGNTALGICLLRKHFNYGIILIQKQANVKVPVWDEFPKRIAKKWADEAKAEKQRIKHQKALASGQINAEMQSSSDEGDIDEENAKTGRDLFIKKVKNTNVFFNNGYGSEDESESEEESSEDDGAAHEQQVFNQQNAFGMTVFQGQKKAMRSMPAAAGRWQNQIHHGTEKVIEDKEVEKELPSKSCFRAAIQNQQQGLAYLILDSGYDYMLAMQDALDEKKFNLVLTLFGKTADDNILRQKNAKQQNLMHILAQNSSGGQFHILKRIYDTLKRRGVNCLERDSLGSNPLHYAVAQGCFDLCQILIEEGVGINDINNDGHSALSLWMQGKEGASKTLRSNQSGQAQIMFESKSMFLLLAKNGADMNVRYPEVSFPEEVNYKCSILINIIRHSAVDMEFMRPNLQCLFEFGAKLDVIDSSGRDVLMYAIIHNDMDLVKFLLNNKANGLIRNHTDHEGKNAIHYVVNPAKFGSFENVAMLNALISVNSFFDLNQKDKLGKTPLEYAQLQESGVMAEVLQSKLGAASKKQIRDIVSYVQDQHWPPRQHNFEEDSRHLLEQAEAKKAQEIFENKKDAYIPLDVVLRGEKQYKVYFDGETHRPYDAYLQKVDLKNGLYGDYVFYKLQLLHDTNRDLYIVLTRWGRIGEEGMNQRSPFNQPEDAKKEFETIFKQKSGNEWATAETEFVKQNKKYSLVHVHYSDVKHQDYLAPFDYDNCAKTQMDKHKRLLLEEIANVTMYQRAVAQQGIDKDQLPISNLKRETLEQAKEILSDLKKTIGELDAERVKYAQANYELVQELRIKISDQSSKYFELIPLAENKDSITRPIDNMHLFQLQYQKLELLTSVEFSSRVLLGALYRQMQVNPVEYVDDCLQTSIRAMQKGDPEFDLIAQYISNTCSTDVSKFKQFTLFKLERRGEGERYDAFKSLKNRRLLFHGSAMTNMLGILAQGLRIAPPEAPTTGYMFGKGVYFADTFDKSAAYTSGHQTRLMLMCEVALGEMMDLYQSFYVETLPTKFNSVRGCGAKGPDYAKKALITPSGFQVPVGKVIEYDSPKEEVVKQSQITAGIPATQILQARGGFPGFGGFGGGFGGRQQQQFQWQLQHNEYIVYNVNQVKIRYMIQFQM